MRHGFEIAAVFTHRDDPAEEVWWESLADRARTRGIPTHFPAREELAAPAFADLVAGYRPDFLFSFYFRWLIPARVLGLAPRGALNLHGSLLPRYRGRAPANWVLVNGERRTGVSLHHMVAKPDAGELVDQESVGIDGVDTAFTLFGKLERAAATVLDRSLPLLRDGIADRTAMDLTAGSYFGGRRPADGEFSWSWPAERIYNLVRAVTHPYPGAFTSWRKRTLLVWWAVPVAPPRTAPPGTVLASDPDGVTVATGDRALRLVTVQLAGQPELPACSFAVAEGIKPGDRLDSPDTPSDAASPTQNRDREGDRGHGDQP
jgi:methionyl-tRNA formyltransferase